MAKAKQKKPALEPKDLGIPSETIDQRLRDLAQLYKLGVKLREVRWIDATSEPGRPKS